jgi:predicted DNA-binding transcriptional regulator AlpA
MTTYTHDPYMTVKQICDERQISPNSFYRYVKGNLIPAGEPAGLRGKRWKRSVIDAAFAAMQTPKR